MIEKIILDYLGENSQYPVFTEKRQQNGKFFVVEKVGGGITNHIKRASVAIQSYGDTLLEAVQLNEWLVKTMENIVSLPEISSCKLDSDYNFTDTQTKKYRYQAVFDLVYY